MVIRRFRFDFGLQRGEAIQDAWRPGDTGSDFRPLAEEVVIDAGQGE